MYPFCLERRSGVLEESYGSVFVFQWNNTLCLENRDHSVVFGRVRTRIGLFYTYRINRVDEFVNTYVNRIV